jgi:hypothetical protein
MSITHYKILKSFLCPTLFLITGLLPLSLAFAANPTCSANVSVIPSVRAEGNSELVGDITLSCTGGNIIAAGIPVPTANISVFFNTGLSSKLLATNFPESLLFIDEPGPGNSDTPANPVFATCKTANGSCTNVGNGDGKATVAHPNYYIGQGTGTNFNTFQATSSAGNALTWSNIPIDGGPHIYRFTNVRLNVSALAGGANGTPAIAAISVSGATSLSISNPSPTIGFVQKSLDFEVRDAAGTAVLTDPVVLSKCQNTENLRIATLRFKELFGTVFKHRTESTASTTPYAQLDQNILSKIYNSESGFFDSSLVGNSARGDLGTSGIASWGTRLKAVFQNIPSGAIVYIDVDGTRIPLGQALQNDTAELIGGNETSLFAQRGTTLGGPPGAAALDSSGIAIWEILDSDPNRIASMDFGVYVSFPANDAALGTAIVNGGFGPLRVTQASSFEGLPKFQAPASPKNLFTISDEGCSVAVPTTSPTIAPTATTAPNSNPELRLILENIRVQILKLKVRNGEFTEKGKAAKKELKTLIKSLGTFIADNTASVQLNNQGTTLNILSNSVSKTVKKALQRRETFKKDRKTASKAVNALIGLL